MKNKNAAIKYATKKMINMDDKAHRDYWLMRWGVSIQQLRAAVKNTNSHAVKLIEEELRRRGAV